MHYPGRERFLEASTAYTRWRNAIKDPERSVKEVFERAGNLKPVGPLDGVSVEAITKVRDASIQLVRPNLIARLPELEEAGLPKGDYQDLAKGLRADFPDLADQVADMALETPRYDYEPPSI